MNAGNRAESIDQSRISPPLIEFCFVGSRAQVAFSSEPSRNLLCATILDIISTSCAYVLSATCCARPRAPRCRSLKLCTDVNISILKQNKSTLWRRNIRKWKFRLFKNARSPFCRTEQFHIHAKIAFFHLSVWLIGQGGWKLCRRPQFDSWQFAV